MMSLRLPRISFWACPATRARWTNLPFLKGRARRSRNRYGFDIDPNQKIHEMSVSQKQTVEIVKVLYRGADILILDGQPLF